MSAVRLLYLCVHSWGEVLDMTITDRCQFGELLNEMGLVGKAAEIGVHRGEFSQLLLRTWRGAKLWLIDPWRHLDDYANDPTNDGDRDADRVACLEDLADQRGRYGVLRCQSSTAAAYFGSAIFDFIYIDANHNEPSVREDLELWYPKLKPGGIFAGHDYLSTVTWPGVQKAVNEFAAKHGIERVNTTLEPGGSWWWVKP